ncbi:hypothetical protein A7K93_08285 [Candidatus Methylacidiphilum fumarolicum]|nr:hypothetical protein A7K73_05525 [Candidatus Methylacidiphilum fumarolicum]TFE71697.1 hypothetical protein A7K72_10415 [Candidatus Methylacidiphilum fumarolicum]TFE72597.1 hypothetical protein A7K93_08285 [Candidatus Methylacidiphilum fumarolicum]TFE76687.1 hypothetical protein A7D33_08610 [Candidatus Methylacidiphilum fumarolicum]
MVFYRTSNRRNAAIPPGTKLESKFYGERIFRRICITNFRRQSKLFSFWSNWLSINALRQCLSSTMFVTKQKATPKSQRVSKDLEDI